MVNFSRLTAHWYRWAPGMGGGDISVSTDCEDCEILFHTDDYSVHLRNDGHWWVVDTVNDRGQRRNGTAKLSSFELAEKFLTWDWLTTVCSSLASGQLGADLYRQGYAPDVGVCGLDNGMVELCLEDDCATLVVGDATIFSHIMKKSVVEILDIERAAGI